MSPSRPGTPRRRTGRRPGHEDTRGHLLAAARQLFGEHGYDATSLRAVARAAEVDPALVVHYFGSKAGLFAAALDLPVDLSAVVPRIVAGPAEGVGERVVRFFLSVWEPPDGRERLLALVRGASSHDEAAATIREFFTEAVLTPVAAAIDRPDPQLRAALTGSQLVGLAMLRYVIRVEPITAADTDTLVAWLAPTVQRYLTGDGPA